MTPFALIATAAAVLGQSILMFLDVRDRGRDGRHWRLALTGWLMVGLGAVFSLALATNWFEGPKLWAIIFYVLWIMLVGVAVAGGTADGWRRNRRANQDDDTRPSDG